MIVRPEGGGWRGRRAPLVTLVHDAAHGFSLMWFREDDALPPQEREMISRADPAAMAEPVPHRTEEVRPRGSFVDGEAALAVLRDFERDPMTLSGAVDWLPYDNVPERARPGINAVGP